MSDPIRTADTAPLPVSHGVTPAQPGDDPISLSYADRLVRRKRLTSDAGQSFRIDLAETRSVDEGDAFALDDGRRIAVRAAAEPLMEVRGPLIRLAWHIGNRHTPCEIAADHLRISADHVLARMLEGLGAQVVETHGPFRPEGGAYGHGRTMGHHHDHGDDGDDAP